MERLCLTCDAQSSPTSNKFVIGEKVAATGRNQVQDFRSSNLPKMVQFVDEQTKTAI